MSVASFGSAGVFVNEPALIVGGDDPQTRKITVMSGQNLKRGTVLGKITVGGAAVAAKAGGNTGNGTLTIDATNPVRVGAKPGVYQVRFIAAATNNGTFRVTDPEGFVLGDVVMAGGAGAFDNDIKFAVADGATDFAVGDGFDITVSAGSTKYVIATAAAVDGSARPSAILAENCDASEGDVESIAHFGGVFDENALTFGAGITAASAREALRDVGIKLQFSVT